MFRFCSKTVPERGRRALRRRSGKRPVALQELPQNAGYSLVIIIRERAYTRAFSMFYSVYALRIHAQLKTRVYARAFMRGFSPSSQLLFLGRWSRDGQIVIRCSFGTILECPWNHRSITGSCSENDLITIFSLSDRASRAGLTALLWTFFINFLLVLFFYKLSFSKQASNDLLRCMLLSAFFL